MPATDTAPDAEPDGPMVRSLVVSQDVIMTMNVSRSDAVCVRPRRASRLQPVSTANFWHFLGIELAPLSVSFKGAGAKPKTEAGDLIVRLNRLVSD